MYWPPAAKETGPAGRDNCLIVPLNTPCALQSSDWAQVKSVVLRALRVSGAFAPLPGLRDPPKKLYTGRLLPEASTSVLRGRPWLSTPPVGTKAWFSRAPFTALRVCCSSRLWL